MLDLGRQLRPLEKNMGNKYDDKDPPPTATSADPDLLTYADVEARTSLARGTLQSMVSRRQVPHVRLGRRLVRFPRLALEAWLTDHFVPANDGSPKEAA
jgi:excisionase family DNA binding protein